MTTNPTTYAERLIADETVSKEDKADLSLAHNARIRAMTVYKETPGKATERDLEAVTKRYDTTVDRLARRYYPTEFVAEVELLPNAKAAHAWLRERYNMKIELWSFTNHCRKGYRCIGDPSRTTYHIPHLKGRYTPGDLDLYARNRGYQLKNGGQAPAIGPVNTTPEAREARERINLATARIQEAKAGEIEGKLLRRDEVEARNAQAAAFLKNDMSNYGPYICDQFVSTVATYLKSRGLDLDSANITAIIPDLLTDYDNRLDNWLNRYVDQVAIQG
jgi:hypothetical protein